MKERDRDSFICVRIVEYPRMRCLEGHWRCDRVNCTASRYEAPYSQLLKWDFASNASGAELLGKSYFPLPVNKLGTQAKWDIIPFV